MGLSGIALVTGGAGFIGSHIASALVAGGARVRILDDLSTGHRENVEEIRQVQHMGISPRYQNPKRCCPIHCLHML